MKRLTAAALGTGLLILSACGDPLAGVERLSAVNLAQNAPQTGFAGAPEAALEQPLPPSGASRSGFFGRLRARPAAPEQQAGGQTSQPAAPVPQPDVPVEEPAEPKPRKLGIFGRLLAPVDASGKAPDVPLPSVQATGPTAPTPPGDAATTASDAGIARVAQPRPRGLFSLRPVSSGASAAPASDGRGAGTVAAIPATPRDASPDLPLSAPLGYGRMVRACDARRRDLGKRVDRMPDRSGGYALFDSDPSQTRARDFFVTGFADGCPRRFTAAMAMFGSPSMHEQLRFGPAGAHLPYSDTEKAFDALRKRICGVGRRKPCGARIDRLEKNTAFISTYENFGANARWADHLLHGGAVISSTIKEG